MRLFIPALLAAFTFLSLNSLAQNCNWKDSKTDPISGQKYLRSKEKRITGDQKFGQADDKKFLAVHITLENGNVFFHAAFTRGVYMSDEKVRNPVLQIRLEDKTLITLNSTESFSTKLTPPGITDIDFRFVVSKADVEALGKSNTSALKLSFSGQDFLFEPKEKRAEDIKEQFNCMAGELGR